MVLLGIIQQLMSTRLNKLFIGAELNPSQFGVLKHFTHDPDRSWTISELADVMEMNQPGITKIVSVLIDKGLLKSREDEIDKRKRHLTISVRGLEMSAEIINNLLPDITQTFSSWEDPQLSDLHRHLEKLMRWFDEHRDDIKKNPGTE
jgi:DNA-binding MarR family transcriptional regulator